MKRLREGLLYPALAGALYTGMTMALAPLSYGAVQCRVSEALCVLPFFLPETAVGLALGCAAANTLSAAGALDVVFGSFATLLAGLCTARLGRSYRKSGVWPRFRVRLAAVLMPVVWNALVIGAVLAVAYLPADGIGRGWALFAAQIAAGELAAMLLAGLPLMRLLRKAGPGLSRWLRHC